MAIQLTAFDFGVVKNAAHITFERISIAVSVPWFFRHIADQYLKKVHVIE